MLALDLEQATNYEEGARRLEGQQIRVLPRGVSGILYHTAVGILYNTKFLCSGL